MSYSSLKIPLHDSMYTVMIRPLHVHMQEARCLLSGALSSYLSRTAAPSQMWSSCRDWSRSQTQHSVGLSYCPRAGTSLLLSSTCTLYHHPNTAKQMHHCSRSLHTKAITDMLSGMLCHPLLMDSSDECSKAPVWLWIDAIISCLASCPLFPLYIGLGQREAQIVDELLFNHA